MSRKPPKIRDNTPEEEAEIQRQIAEDPDTWEIPKGAKVLKRGRPSLPADKKKQQITILLDPDVLDHFKSKGKGYQTEINDALRKAAGL